MKPHPLTQFLNDDDYDEMVDALHVELAMAQSRQIAPEDFVDRWSAVLGIPAADIWQISQEHVEDEEVL